MKLKYIFTLAFSLCFSLFSSAQKELKQSNFMIFGVPQYLFTNGLRIDFDVHQKNTRNWYVISPYFYSDKSSVDPMNLGGSDEYYDLYSYDKMVGGGLGLSKRIFLSNKSTTDGFYLSYGACYRYFNIEGNSFTWVEYTDKDDLKKQTMDDLKYKLSIHSINANAVLGYMVEVMPSLYLDFYMGFGVKYSIHNSPQHVTVKYNRGYYDYGYTGTQFIGGLRVGVRL